MVTFKLENSPPAWACRRNRAPGGGDPNVNTPFSTAQRVSMLAFIMLRINSSADLGDERISLRRARFEVSRNLALCSRTWFCLREDGLQRRFP
jgi:hypothetical protein